MVNLEKIVAPTTVDAVLSHEAQIEGLHGAVNNYAEIDPTNLSHYELVVAYTGVMRVAHDALGIASVLAEERNNAHTDAVLEKHRADEVTAERDKLKRVINEQQSGIDSLTFVGNRPSFELHIEDAVKTTAERGHNELVLIGLDLENLHGINASYGYTSGGDALLMMLAEKLQSEEVRTSGQLMWRADDVFRYGGDEFFVICRHITPRNASMKRDDVAHEEHVRIENELDSSIHAAADQLELKDGDKRPHAGVTVTIESMRPGDNAKELRSRTLASLRGAKRYKQSLLQRRGVSYARNDY